jgi:hypothetical protein
MAANRVGRKVRPYLQKAKDSALLAVEVYNKPGTSFKSAAYIALMTIAWTSLFHAIFLKNGKNPYRKAKNGRYEIIEGDYRHWELKECTRQYWKNDSENPVRKNVEFFIPLRNKIEHRHIPQIDPAIFGECQSLILNFDNLIGEHFGVKHQLREVLSFSLQMFPSGESFGQAAKSDKQASEIKKFIEDYRGMLSTEVLGSGQFAFKAFLIQVGNHQSVDALPIQFLQHDQMSEEQREQFDKFAVAVKWKTVRVANDNLMKPKDVIRRVARTAKCSFSQHDHQRAWKRHNVRPASKSSSPELTNAKYCVYDSLGKGYGYTEEWVELLINEIASANAASNIPQPSLDPA